MKAQVLDHFQRVDPILYKHAVRCKPFELQKSTDYFLDLCEAIISQQLSTKAATTIFTRFNKLFHQNKPTPKKVLASEFAVLRSIGISESKARYITGLSQAIVQGSLDVQTLDSDDQEVVIEKLTAIKGIGRWTAEMFLMFSQGREDVFSAGDLGLKRAIQAMYQFKREPAERTLLRISKKWSPYRTYACRVLWSTFEK